MLHVAGVGLQRRFAATVGVCVFSSFAAIADAQQITPQPGKPGNPICLKLNEETPEQYGPTDIGATTGNGRLSVAVNPQGTLSVMRWPSVSYWEQLKYFTIDRDDPMLGLWPNEGAFSGIAATVGGERRTIWFRDLRVRQRYRYDDSDTIVTTYRARNLGLTMRIVDVVPAEADVLVRSHRLRLTNDSPLVDPTLIAFANFNPTASKRAILPTEDWCEEVGGTDRGTYDAESDSITHSISEFDQSTGQQRSVTIAMGAGEASLAHALGADSYTGHASAIGGQSAFDDAADGSLSGRGERGPGEVDSALELPIEPDPVNVVFAAAETPADATALLDRYRDRDADALALRKLRADRRWMDEAPLPRDAPPAVERLARRSLVSLRQVVDERAGANRDLVAITASISTQSPYFLDWIRDGAFFNEVLDRIGHHDLVKRHNLFYAEVQKTSEEGAPPGSPLSVCEGPTPAGNWFMTNYADGVDAGTFTWEIDEAAFGLWTLWRHYGYLVRAGKREAAAGYLDRIYPSIRETAEFLVAFRDAETGLMPGTACEDDNPPRQGQPTMHASGPVLLAMRSAEAAARRLGRTEDEARYAERRAELEAGIDAHHVVEGGAWTRDFGDGGWALWPVEVKPYDDSRSRAQAEAVRERVSPSFAAPEGPKMRGQYEAKALHGLAYFHRAVDRAGLKRVRAGLRWIAEVQAADQRTGILGEAWYVRDGKVISVVAQPHVWEQVLFYLAALKTYGREDFRPAG